MANEKILAHAAEAIIYKKGNVIIKDRIKKSYRIPELDNKIRKQRTKSETKLLEKASKIISCPIPEELKESNKIKMPFIDGKKLSEHLNSFSPQKQKQICEQIGKSVAKLHDANIIHGDLTTSNMILVENLPAHSRSQINEKSVSKEQDKIKIIVSKKFSPITNFQRSVITKSDAKPSDFACHLKKQRSRELLIASEASVYFIDFGLGFISHKLEDKAVDLHLLKQALEAKHFQNWEILFKEIIKGYSKSKDSEKVLEQLKKVEKRGRYKS